MPPIPYSVIQEVLSTLIGAKQGKPLLYDTEQLSLWLQEHDLGPLAYHAYRRTWPDLAKLLRSDYYAAAAENDILFAALKRVVGILDQASLPFVLLKGMAVSLYAYPEAALRTKSDIDIWVGRSTMRVAERLFLDAGFVYKLEGKPFNQYGKIEFMLPNWVRGNIDLHAQMLGGYWLDNVANIHDDDLFAQTREINFGEQKIRVLSTEDAILHAALHVAINHKFDSTSLRGLTDVALLCQQSDVNWLTFAEKVHAREVSTVIGFVFEIIGELFQIPYIEEPLKKFRLPSPKKRLLSQFISAESIASGYDLSKRIQYYLFQLLLIDTWSKATRLMGNKLLGTKRFNE